MPTYQEHVEGVLAAFNAVEKVAYSIDSLPDVLPPAHIVVSVSRRFGGVQDASGERHGHLGRIGAVAFGKTLAGAYRMWDVIDAVQYSTLTIGGVVSTPVEFETDDDVIEPAAGWYSGTKSLSYALI